MKFDGDGFLCSSICENTFCLRQNRFNNSGIREGMQKIKRNLRVENGMLGMKISRDMDGDDDGDDQTSSSCTELLRSRR